MFKSNFEVKIKSLLNNIINIAENNNPNKVQNAFKHIIKIKKEEVDFNYYLTEQTLHNITNIYSYINYLESIEDKDKHIIMILKLYSYLHCIESRYTYKVIGNILRIIKNKNIKGNLFDNSHSGIQCFNSLKNNANNFENTNINKLFDHWESFIDKNLRNSISHNDYLISENILIIPSNTLKHIDNQKTKQYTYTNEEINKLYNKANRFQNAFKTIAQKYGKALGPRY